MSENVLVFPATILDGYSIDGFIPNCDDLIKDIFSSRRTSFLSRELAENDPNFKQIIPYYVFVHDGKFLCYTRTCKSGEVRLRNKTSIGIGGHINDGDDHSFEHNDNFAFLVFVAGSLREIAEEVVLPEEVISNDIVGAIYDDSNEVGRVHFGIVAVIVLGSPEIELKDPASSKAEWLTLEELAAQDTLENWSRLFVDYSLEHDVLWGREVGAA